MQTPKSIEQMSRPEIMDYLAKYPSECQEDQPIFQELLKRSPSSEDVELAAQLNEWQMDKTSAQSTQEC